MSGNYYLIVTVQPRSFNKAQESPKELDNLTANLCNRLKHAEANALREPFNSIY